jgi:transcription elongation factor Elf1
MGGDSDNDDEAAMMWQDVLDQVAAGRPSNLRCPYCEKGEVSVTSDEQSKRTKLACKSCKRFIEVRLADPVG